MLNNCSKCKVKKWWIPDNDNGFYFVDEIPHNYIGKIDKKQLRKMYG
mgnify:FL=1